MSTLFEIWNTIQAQLFPELEKELDQVMMFCKEHDTCILDDDLQAIYPKFREMDVSYLPPPL